MAQAFAFQFNLPLPDLSQTLTNVLFINETPAESDTLEVESKPLPGVTLTLMAVSDKVVSSSNHHLKFTFRPDTLVRPEEILLDASHDGQWGLLCEIEKRVPASESDGYALGDVYLYVLYKGETALEVTSSKPLALTLKKVGAVAGKGTRPTLAQLTLHRYETYVTLSGPDGDYNRTENSDLGLINTSMGGTLAPSLEAEFSSSNIVLNDGATQNHLVLRIVNTGLVPILLTPGTTREGVSRFSLRFESSEDISHLWALGTSSQLSSILIPGKSNHSGTDPDWPGKASWNVEGPNQLGEWTLTPKPGNITLEKGMAIEVPISKVVTGHATGRTALLVRYGGLPGYNDGERVAFIQKHPLKFADQMVGIGTGSPTDKLTVETDADKYGITHSDGTVKLSTRLRGTSSARAAGVGTQTNHDLFLYTYNSVSSPVMTLKTNGRVGIGTSAPDHPLEVRTTGGASGFSHTDGTHVLTTRVGPTGGWLGTFSAHDLHFFTGNKTDPQVTLKTDGRVGIGTSAPDFPLQVRTSASKHGISHTDGTRTLTSYVNNQGGWFGTNSNHDLHFFTGNKIEPQLALTTTGRVGIGTYTPAFPLQVKTGAGAHGLSHTDGTRTLTTYVSDKGGWLGTQSNHDLHLFTNNDGYPLMTLTTDDRLLIKGEAPFQCKSVTVARGSASGNTGFSESEWVVFVAGFFLNADDDSKDKDISFNCYPKVYGSTWHIYADVEQVSDEWRVHVIAIRRALITGNYSY